MTRTRLEDPRPVAGDRVAAWMSAKLTERGLTLASGPIPDERPEPSPAEQAAQKRIPYDYRQAVADHRQVTAWVQRIAAAATAGDLGGRGRREIAHGPSLLLWGPTGTGKTHQAYGAIRALTAAGCATRWDATTAADLYGQMRPRPGIDVEYQLRKIVRVPLLLLDDLGAAKSSEWTEELTFRLLNWRCQNRLPTLITTNLPPVREQRMHPQVRVLRDMVGDRVLSRLSGMCEPVEFTGSDRRFATAA
nr:ATP-binding protein [Streptomyces sp. NBC_00899]